MKMNLYIDGGPLVADTFSGVGHFTLGIVSALDRVASTLPNIDITLVIISEYKDRLRPYDFKNIKIKFIPIALDEFYGKLFNNELHAIDLLIGNGVYFFTNYATWPLKYSKAITTIHDLSFEDVPQFTDKANALFLDKTVRSTIKRADYISTVTNTMKNRIAKFYKLDKNKIVVINNAVDLDKFHDYPKHQILHIVRKYGIKKKYILCVGNIEPRKNQEILLKALDSMAETIVNNYSIVFAGADGWKNDNFYNLANELAKKLDIIILKNVVSDADMPILYNGAEVSINPSFYEGFGMPTIEAMACHTPVILSDIPVNREVGGPNALFADPYSVKDVASKVEQVLAMKQDVKNFMTSANYKKATEYSWDDSARSLIEVAKKLS